MASDTQFDLIVVGAGPGGYGAALRAAKIGMRPACIEREPNPGGICLHAGCIPSKALLESTEHLSFARKQFREQGIVLDNLSFDLGAMMERKRKIVSGLSDSLRQLLLGSGIALISGTARLVSGKEVSVTGADGKRQVYRAESILLAAGSEPAALPFLPFDGKNVIGSTECLGLDSVPKRLGIIGGGYIGLELGSVWARLGAEVTVIEVLPGIAATLDLQVARLLERVLKKEGIRFRMETRLTRAEAGENGVRLFLDSAGGQEEETFDKVLVAVGRKPLTRGLGIEELGIRLDSRGFVAVDRQYRTSVPSVRAIGDMIPGPMLAHKASAEGAAAVECMAGLPGEVDYDAMPSAVYTSPEVGSVGKTEEELKRLKIDYRAGVYPFSGTGRARCLGQTDGFVKMLVHAGSRRILGVHIIGPRASELIAEATFAVRTHMSVEDFRATVHSHPTLSEALHECAALL
ncbi:MAG: dihydrolipoyl dehydrogenase [Desulfobacteraceae bacterium]|nr:dihydrolipoyl dehydrogenase [Desulfobacteraceae bacterium]